MLSLGLWTLLTGCTTQEAPKKRTADGGAGRY